MTLIQIPKVCEWCWIDYIAKAGNQKYCNKCWRIVGKYQKKAINKRNQKRKTLE